MNYMGIDHHKQCSHITFMDEKREVLKSGKVANYHSELKNIFQFSIHFID